MSTAEERIPLAKPIIGDRERELVDEVLRSGQLSLGPMVPRFERAWAERIGVKHAVAVSSGTAGLHLCLHALGLGPGDEVITSSFSFVASANAILFTGADARVRRGGPAHVQHGPRRRRGGDHARAPRRS